MNTANGSAIPAVHPPSTTFAILLAGPSTQRHESSDRQERHAGHEAGQYHHREHPGDRTLVDHVDVVYRRFLPTRRREVNRTKESQSRDGDEQVVSAHVASF